MSKFKIKEVDINDIKLIEKNARFMNQTTFRQLVSNIKRDGELSSVPFCVEKEDKSLVVVSGNHRVQAARMAGLIKLNVMYIEEANITNDEIRGIQLSHNSIAGEDDPQILKELLDEITEVAMKEYAHISKEILESVSDINYSVELPSNEVVPVLLMFVETDKIKMDRLFDELENYTSRELESMQLFDKSYLERLNKVTSSVGQKYKIKSQALSIMKMVEMVEEKLNELK